MQPTDGLYPYIETVVAYHLMSGYSDGMFHPANAVTWGQFAKFIVLTQALTEGWVLENPPTPTFSDVPPGATFYQYIETVYMHGDVYEHRISSGVRRARPRRNIL